MHAGGGVSCMLVVRMRVARVLTSVVDPRWTWRCKATSLRRERRKNDGRRSEGRGERGEGGEWRRSGGAMDSSAIGEDDALECGRAVGSWMEESMGGCGRERNGGWNF